MAEKGKSGKSGGGRKKPTGKALRYLWASGVLGKGKKGKTKYNKGRSKQLGRLKKRGVDTTVKRGYRNTPSGSTRPVIGGSKAAGLRSGAGSGAASKPSRAERIEAGKAQAAYGVRKLTFTRKAGSYAREKADEGYALSAQSSAAARASGFQSTKEAAKLIQGQQTIPRARRIAKGRKVLEQFRASQEAKNQAAYGGGLFAPKAPTPKPRPDYSSTRAARVAAGNKIANSLPVARKALKGTGLRVRESNRADAMQNPLTASGSSKTAMNAKGGTRFLVQTARTVGAKPPRPKVGTAENNATRAARVAKGKAIAAQNPEVQRWKGNQKNMVIANRARAQSVARSRQEAAAKKAAVQKATDAYTRALVRANANLLDGKAQRGRKRAYDKLVSTAANGSKSRASAYKSEIDSALRRARAAARKKGSYLP